MGIGTASAPGNVFRETAFRDDGPRRSRSATWACALGQSVSQFYW